MNLSLIDILLESDCGCESESNQEEEHMNLSLANIIDNNYSKGNLQIMHFLSDLKKNGKLHKYHINDDTEPLGKGGAGVIVKSSEDGYVIKLSTDRKDYDNAVSFRKKGLKSIVPIKGAWLDKLPCGRDVHILKVGRMEQFPDDMQEFLDKYILPMKRNLDKERKQMSLAAQKGLSKKFLRMIKKFYRSRKNTLSPKEKKILRNMIRFVKDVHKHKHHFHDRQISQFMLDKKGNLRLVDLGAIEDSNSKLY